MSSAGQLSELDLLRGQVADLSRQLVERDRSMQDLCERSQLLRTIVEGTASGTGDEFFASLVRHLTSTLHVQYAVISEVLEVPFRKIRTLAVSAGDTLIDNFEYDLDHTPCGTALTQTFACFNRDLQATFPEFQRLVDLEAESYCAVPIRTKDGEVRGLLVVMDTKPLENSDDLQSLLRVFAPRIAAEFEWRRVEQEHAMALAEIHNVIETVPDIMFTLDTHGNMVKWNRRVEDVTGYSPEELLNMPALAFVPPQEHIPTAAAIQQAFMEGYAELDGQLLTKDLRTIPYHWTGALLKNSHGEPIGITGIGRDVSGKKRVEKALRESEHRFALAVEGSSDILWDALRLSGEPWYAPQTPIWWSPRVREWLGLEESESFETFEHWIARLHLDDKDHVFGQLAAHIEQRVPYDVEYRLRTNAGDYRWIRGRGQAQWDEQGEPRRMSGSCQDITERKQVEKALCESEERYRTLIDLSPNGVFVYCSGKKVYVNQAACTILGASSPEQLLDNPTFHFSHPDDYEAVHTSLAQILATEKPVRRVERKYQRLDGTAVFVEVDAGRIMWNGEPAVQVIFADITERKRMEEERQKQEVLITLMLNTGPACIKRVAADGSLLHMNPTGLKLVEACGETEVVGRSVFGLIAPEHRDAYIAMHRSVIEGHECMLQFEIQGLKGTRRWMESYAVPFRNPATGQTEQLAVTHDITERKRAEAALRESEAFNISVLNSLSSQIVALNSQGVIIAVNKPWLRFAEENGASHLVENFAGMNYLNVCAQAPLFAHGEEAASAQAGILAVLAGTQNEFSLEYPCHSPDQQRWFRMRVTPLLDSQKGVVVAHENITERKLAELVLREREEVLARFKATLDQTHDCVFMFAPDTLSFIYCNRGAVEQVGYSEVELFTMTPLDLKPEFTERSFREMLQPLKDGRMDSHVFETIHRHKDGHDVAVEISLQLVREEGRFLAVVRDITERKQAEKALRESEERFDLAVRGSNTGIWDWDLRTGKTYFSPLWKSMLGYEEQELRGELFEWEERLHPDDRERSSATVRAYLEGVTSQYELEHRLRHKDGSYRWIMARGVSICNTEGKPYRMAGSHIDITEQKQTQEALARSERQLRTVLDALPVGVWFTDRAGKPLLANPAAKQIWSNIKQIGLQTENPQAGWWETIGPVNEPHRWALSHVLTTGVPSLNETFDFECLDGTKKTIRSSTIPVNDEDGMILGAIVLNEDITLLRQAQAALQLTQFSVDHAVDGFLWIGPDARLFDVNDSICRMLEYTREELTTMTLHDIDPNISSEVWPVHWEELKEKRSLTFESKYWSRTGRVLDMEVTVNYLQYEGKEYNCAIMRDIGERKRIEEAVKVSEQAIRTLYEAIATPALSFDQRIQAVLEVGCRRFQLPIGVLTKIVGEDLTLTHVWAPGTSFTAGMAVPLCTTYCDAAVQSVDPVCVEHAGSSEWRNHPGYKALGLECYIGTKLIGLEHIYGTLCFMGQDPYPTTFSQADTNFLQLMARWITGELDRRKSEQALIQSEERYRSLYDETPTMYFTLAVDGTVCSVNRFGAEQLGYQAEELIGHSVLGLFRKADQEAVAASLSECFATPEVTRYWEFRKLRKDGSMIWVREAARVGRSAADEAVVLVTCEDITARKQAEDALRVSKERLSLATRGSNTGIWDWDLETNRVYFSQIWKSMLGYEEHELRGEFSEWDELIHSDDRARAQATVRAYLDGTTPQYELEHRLRHKDGSYRWILARGVTLSDAQGIPYRMAGSHIDITERKHMEETLRQRERTLRVAIEDRERISQDLHDGILQSLFAVGLALESAKSMIPPKSRKMAGPRLNQAIDQLNDVMREIRNFIAGMGSDLLQGKDLPASLKQMLGSLTEHQPTRVRLAVEGRAVKALSTEQSMHLIRVIQEAVSNCIKHGHAQEARVSLKMLKRGVRLSVRDNGRGFDQGATKKMGHGLTNMAARARKIGGKFTILSKVNEGTSIVLDLPKEVADVSR